MAASDLHTVGRWAPRQAQAEVHAKACQRRRARYGWEPLRCTLQEYGREEACRLLHASSVSFVGDSTMNQLREAVSDLLQARYASTMKRVVGSACDDTVRLSYTRNDLLLWSHDYYRDADISRGCTSGTHLLRCWTRGATNATVVVLGVGQHFPGSFRKFPGQVQQQQQLAAAFAVNSLNHTLAALMAARRGHGTVVVLGASLAVPGCEHHSEPLTSANVGLAKYASPANRTAWASSWWEQHHVNEAAKLAASAWGAEFLDVAAPSLQAAWGAMGDEHPTSIDCVHYCPESGVVGAWAQLLFNLLQAKGEGPSTEPTPFYPSLRDFLAGRNVEDEVSDCCMHGACHASPRGADCLSAQPWWPFGCASDPNVSRCDRGCRDRSGPRSAILDE